MTAKECVQMIETLKKPENLTPEVFEQYGIDNIMTANQMLREELGKIGLWEQFDQAFCEWRNPRAARAIKPLVVEPKKMKTRSDSETGTLYQVPEKKIDCLIKPVEGFEEKEIEWLVWGYIPKRQITVIAGEGGTGKTTIECNLAAAVSTGRNSFLLPESEVPEEFQGTEKQKIVQGNVLIFSAEESITYTLKRRLRKAGADLTRIYSIDAADERFPEVKFNSELLQGILEQYKPVLCIFDPIQAFVPSDIHMGNRNAIRACMTPLIGYGEKYGTSFVIAVHAIDTPHS